MNKFVYVLLAGLVISVVILFVSIDNMDSMDAYLKHKADSNSKYDAENYEELYNNFCALRASLWDLQKNTDYTLLNQGSELRTMYSAVDMFSSKSAFGNKCKALDY